MLPLTNSVIVDYAKKGRKKFVFSVNIPSARIYFISAKSEEDRDDWMKAISDTIKTQKTDKLSLKDFRVISIIGKGSDGKVTLVKELNSGQLYAMKIIKKSSVADNEQISQTMSERNVLMRVKHPFLIGLRYSFQTEEKLYMVLDYAPGGELFYHLKKSKRFPETLACLYVSEIILGLEHLHRMDVIYRDLKLENLLLDQEGHIKITDFGLVKTDLNKKFGGKTKTICGTPEYVAPEILLDEGYEFSVDWWSLGILLYEMVCGIPPFFSEDKEELYSLILDAKIKIPFYVRDSTKDLITKLLTRNPKKRLGYNGAEEIKNHEFFDGIDWEKLYNRGYTPEFIPTINKKDDLQNFDQKFTSIPISIPNKKKKKSSKKNTQNDFQGFTYIGEIQGIEIMEQLDEEK
ncbi:non-specific serine/threonine protein kinase [Anaeramoeba flamelloides]|uniref:non-specific serine/threonine protein kinase n=1 Tax=Anaeramoeba flamelloides TaxID=1746091 RepID=A0ABQ8XD72_9EUKA|nr:non-specific serine/threonine protein kinase [Anaeramoeba flamelloides]